MIRWLVIISICNPFLAISQIQVPSAIPDRNEIFIGESVTVELKVEYNPAGGTVEIVFPTIGDTLTKFIEVLEQSAIDSLQGPNQASLLWRQEIVITSFDTGYHPVPPFVFTLNGKLVATNPFLLTVRFPDVDTEGPIREIKDIYDLRAGFLDYLKAYWKVLLGVFLILLAIAAFIWWYRKRPKPQPLEPVIPEVIDTRLPHEKALEMLNALKAKQLWQQGQVKAYYTALSDIVRTYIENRYPVHALERTTAETLTALRMEGCSQDNRNLLSELLGLSDLVKFAKVLPTAAENENAIEAAERFVERTKKLPVVTEATASIPEKG